MIADGRQRAYSLFAPASASRLAHAEAGAFHFFRFDPMPDFPSDPSTLPDREQPVSELHKLPDSPCIGICSTLFDDVCQGCGRTAVEVSNWVFLSDEEKLSVWRRITAEGTAVRFVRGPQG